uniref:hypothetical protein n=1 Tax=Bacillus sp. WP8 TaxID=756828 RepID=UPI001C92F9C7
FWFNMTEHTDEFGEKVGCLVVVGFNERLDEVEGVGGCLGNFEKRDGVFRERRRGKWNGWF